ncbi:sugar phosphate nucleotidyltransferase [Fulvivirgaceae bacterium BMA10]|uniref:Sugar phosphate nucleotidyltransferase n=1 Tax=Splendidivirga corallicola TaxID=3051826 RepID=A0ABT8KJY4_9BACT|nr:sugar phosphate nucleotidyltransferase [Fulvivirgaceae bacterium BMA10]
MENSNSNNYLVIMAGGVGSRFWPFSRTGHPKQFHDLLGNGKSLMQQTYERFKDLCSEQNIMVVTNAFYHDQVKEQLPFLSDDQILCEPCMRNTAPCIAYAAHKIHKRNKQANLIITPADHAVTNEEKFRKTIEEGIKAVGSREILLTLGIQPSEPNTGYGYIQFDEGNDGNAIKDVKRFVEKPSLEKARDYLKSGDFVWNAGIFISNVETLLKSYEEHLPEVHNQFNAIRSLFYTLEERPIIDEIYTDLPEISIDHGIMEKADNVCTLPCEFGWSDLGTWKSLHQILPKDTRQNVIEGNVLAYNTNNSIIKTSESLLVVTQGLDGYIVAEKDNVLMICKKEDEQEVKEIVAKVRSSKGNEFV